VAQGFSVSEVSVPLYPRHAGTSKFGIGRIPVGVLDMLAVWFELRFAKKPLLLFGMLGAGLFVFGVLAGLFLARSGLEWADPALALIVAILVGRAGYQILRRSIPTLVDERALDQATIQREAEGVTGVVSAYAIRSRHAGDRRFAELTIAVDGSSNVTSAHLIADQVEDRLRDTLQLDEVTVHVEPC